MVAETVPAAQVLDISDTDGDDESVPEHATSFIPGNCIGKNIKWNASLPKCVRRARDAARAVPVPILNASSLSSTASVAELLRLRQQEKKDLVIIYGVTPSFSYEPPTVSFDLATPLSSSDEVACTLLLHHLRFALTSVDAVEQLRKSFNDAWLSGAQSVALPGGISVRYPLWAENLLRLLRESERKKDLWYRSFAWIRDSSDGSKALADSCLDSWDTLPWNSRVPGFSTSVQLHTEHLSLLLSTSWLSDEMMNGGLDFIIRQLGPDPEIYVANCLFLPYLRACKLRGEYCSIRESRLDAAVLDSAVYELHIPINVNNQHWTLLTVNIEDRTYSYADSSNAEASPSKQTLDLITWWLRELGHAQYQSGGVLAACDSPYDVPQQTDSHSCGVVVLSTLAAYLFDYEPWSQKTARQHRMQWYLRLSEALLNDSEVRGLNRSRSISVS